ncbi:TPA: 50S ribosomal protein L18e [Candidatus Micrarchaeota archaeon]|nr:50S ribosomal protein L18e [Candidatus Micrarchaeota archaeon]
MKNSKFRGPENPRVKKLIALLEKSVRKGKSGAWALVAEFLQKPSRGKKAGVNIYKIERIAQDGDFVVVPTAILGEGTLTKKIEIACLKASKSAREKLGAKLLTLEQAIEKNPSGKKVRVIV